MIRVEVVDSNARRVVLQGTAEGVPALSQRWTVLVDAIALDPGLLAQTRDELYARMSENLDKWNAAQAAIASLNQ
jgi:hypothetical protein